MLPIKKLPDYIRSVKDNGQDMDDIPVVDMGNIVNNNNNWLKSALYATSFCLFLGLGLVAYNKSFTVVIESSSDLDNVSRTIVSGGGTIYSVKQEDESYRIKFFTFKNINHFIKKLRENNDFKKVELKN